MPIFRVSGMAPDDPATAAVLDHFAASMRHFYRKAASMTDAGFIEHEHMIEDRGDHKLRYQRLQGQEIVTITPQQVTGSPPAAGVEGYSRRVVFNPDYIFISVMSVRPETADETDLTTQGTLQFGYDAFREAHPRAPMFIIRPTGGPEAALSIPDAVYADPLMWVVPVTPDYGHAPADADQWIPIIRERLGIAEMLTGDAFAGRGFYVFLDSPPFDIISESAANVYPGFYAAAGAYNQFREEVESLGGFVYSLRAWGD